MSEWRIRCSLWWYCCVYNEHGLLNVITGVPIIVCSFFVTCIPFHKTLLLSHISFIWHLLNIRNTLFLNNTRIYDFFWFRLYNIHMTLKHPLKPKLFCCLLHPYHQKLRMKPAYTHIYPLLRTKVLIKCL